MYFLLFILKLKRLVFRYLVNLDDFFLENKSFNLSVPIKYFSILFVLVKCDWFIFG